MPASLSKIIKRGLSSSSLGPFHNKNKTELPSAVECVNTFDSDSAPRFEDRYKLGKKLSTGCFGVVHVAANKETGEEFAVKVISRANLERKDTKSVEREVKILEDCQNVKNIVQLIEVFRSPSHYHVVQVYAKGGDVFQRIAQRTSYTESLARSLASQLLEAVEVLHARNIVHRDLKPENLLLRDSMDDTAILVADFGFASYVNQRDKLTTKCGTPAFVAPEILARNCRYDERVDLWSVGCLLYMLIGGYPPFQGRTHADLFRKIRGADFVFHDKYWKNVSKNAKQLIASLLTVDPEYRCTARQALQTCSWLEMEEKLLMKHDLAESLGEIKKFHAGRTLRVMNRQAKSAKSTGDLDITESSTEYDSDKEGTDADLNKSEHGIQRENSDSVLVQPKQSFHILYELSGLLHEGQGFKLFECVHRQTREVFAVKTIHRDSQAASKRTVAESVLHEVAILDSVEHKNIEKIHEVFEDDDNFYLVVERTTGADVFSRVVQMKKYGEVDARRLARRLLGAVEAIHRRGIVHRDIKPHNLLLRSEDDNADILLSGFGFACRVPGPQSLTTRCGTPSYVPPEVLKNIPYDERADMWSVGVILYVILCGYPPFVDKDQSELFRKIRSGEYHFRGPGWGNTSKEARNLIRGLLATNPDQRLTAQKARMCKWLKEGENSDEPSGLSVRKLKVVRVPRSTKSLSGKEQISNGGQKSPATFDVERFQC